MYVCYAYIAQIIASFASKEICEPIIIKHRCYPCHLSFSLFPFLFVGSNKMPETHISVYTHPFLHQEACNILWVTVAF